MCAGGSNCCSDTNIWECWGNLGSLTCTCFLDSLYPFQDGTWGTIKRSCTVVQDFADMCYHSFPVYLRDLRESPSSNDRKPLRYDAHSGGEREIQRTMFELLNQLDGFDSRGDVKELDDGKILLRVAHLYEVDTVTSIQRKTFGLALSIILTLRLPQVLDKLDQILSVCTSVILGGSEDLTEEESSNDNISSTRPHFPSKEFRKRQIKISDPVNQSSLENSVRENLQTCAALHGESFNSAISRMHPAAFDQLKQALKMT